VEVIARREGEPSVLALAVARSGVVHVSGAPVEDSPLDLGPASRPSGVLLRPGGEEPAADPQISRDDQPFPPLSLHAAHLQLLYANGSFRGPGLHGSRASRDGRVPRGPVLERAGDHAVGSRHSDLEIPAARGEEQLSLARVQVKPDFLGSRVKASPSRPPHPVRNDADVLAASPRESLVLPGTRLPSRACGRGGAFPRRVPGLSLTGPSPGR
jgi:hypothetical protein